MNTQGPQNILCPVDFSELSALGLRYAQEFATCTNARITAMYADQFLPPPYFTSDALKGLEKQFRESISGAEDALREFVARTIGTEVAARSRVDVALPVDAILRVADETSAGLIVMGTHGRNGINRWMLGSVTERVLRASNIPVLTVRGELKVPVKIKHILCPVNDSDLARQALTFATRLARCAGAVVTVAHVEEPISRSGAIFDLCSWVPQAEREHCELRMLTRKGDAASEILKLASELPANLLVLGSQHRRFFDSTVIGTTTVRVVRHAQCPVLTVVGAPPLSRSGQ